MSLNKIISLPVTFKPFSLVLDHLRVAFYIIVLWTQGPSYCSTVLTENNSSILGTIPDQAGGFLKVSEKYCMTPPQTSVYFCMPPRSPKTPNTSLSNKIMRNIPEDEPFVLKHLIFNLKFIQKTTSFLNL